MKLTASTGTAYEKPKPGTYMGVLVGFAECGTQQTDFGPREEVLLCWELHRRKGPAMGEEGILTVVKNCSCSFDSKSNLRKVVEAHVGPYKDGETVDSHSWLGTAARLVLVETKSKDKTYVNVDSVTPLDPDEDEKPKPVSPFEHWEMSDATPPPQWAKWKVDKSLDRTGEKPRHAGKETPVGAGASKNGNGGVSEDDVPF